MKKRLPCSGIGGQAVLEGIMMRNKNKYSVAVRTEGEINCQVGQRKPITERTVFARIPFVRGIFMLIDSLVLGIRALTYSSQFVEEEEVEPDKFENWLNKKFGERAEKVIIGFTIAISIILAIALFMILPLFIADVMERNISWVTKQRVPIIEGVLKVIIFIIYLMLTALIKDIRRTYMYHGAEHKCINCVETGHELNVENVRRSSRFHKRCGTSFLFVIILISIIIFLLVRPEAIWLRYLIRILLLPVIAGLSYEFIKYAGSKDNLFVTICSKPGLWMQRITTREPSDDMIEVAIEATEAVFDWQTYLEDNGIDVRGRVRPKPQAKPQSYVRPTPHDLPKRDNNSGSGFNWKF